MDHNILKQSTDREENTIMANQTIYSYMADLNLDPFLEEDLKEAGRKLIPNSYNVTEAAMDDLRLQFIVTNLYKEIGFATMQEFRVKLTAYYFKNRRWYEKMYTNFLDLNPLDFLDQTVEATETGLRLSTNEEIGENTQATIGSRDTDNNRNSTVLGNTNTIDDVQATDLSKRESNGTNDQLTTNKQIGNDKTIGLTSQESDDEGSNTHKGDNTKSGTNTSGTRNVKGVGSVNDVELLLNANVNIDNLQVNETDIANVKGTTGENGNDNGLDTSTAKSNGSSTANNTTDRTSDDNGSNKGTTSSIDDHNGSSTNNRVADVKNDSSSTDGEINHSDSLDNVEAHSKNNGSTNENTEGTRTQTTKGQVSWKPELMNRFYAMYVDLNTIWVEGSTEINGTRDLFMFVYDN